MPACLGAGTEAYSVAPFPFRDRNGADYSVFINTAHDFDGSDAGAKPDEAVSWGKIRLTAKPVKVSELTSIV
jgi:deoxyhypusine synthase